MSLDNKFEVQSPLGYKVVCLKRQWDHITKGHSMMANKEKEIKETLSDPEVIYESEEWPDKRDVYFKACSNVNAYTKVVIDKPDQYNEEGSVVSAWIQRGISGNISKGGPKYVKSKSGQTK